MNGFTWLVLLATTGQVAAPPAPQQDYGWQINNSGELEYIVQISPEKAEFMMRQNQEFASEIPAEIALRASKIVVSIGRDPIVSTPIEEVRKLPIRASVANQVMADIEAVAGRGKFSDLESGAGGSVRNVGGNNAPPNIGPGGVSPLPEASTATTPSLGSSSLSDNLLAQSGASGFLNDARGAALGTGTKFSNTGTPAATPLPTAPASLPSTPLPPAASTNAPLAQTTTLPAYPGNTAAAQPGMTPITPNTLNPAGIGTGMTAGGMTAGGMTAGGIATNTTGNAAGSTYPNASYPNATYPNTTTPGYGQPGYTGTPVYGNNSSTTGLGNLAGTGNFGAPPRSATTQLPYGQVATTPGWNGYQGATTQTQVPYAQTQTAGSTYTGLNGYNQPSPYASDPYALRGNSPAYYLADNRNNPALPTTSGAGSFVNTGSGVSTSGYPTNTGGTGATGTAGVNTNGQLPRDPYTTQYPTTRSGMENVVPVMFVLSLVVNFYLGMLIRKLLTRYRSLLTSVRSQTV